MFKQIDPKKKLSELEHEILDFWCENKVFEKSVERNSEDRAFVFYEGPPTANGKPGLHHVLARAFKDIIPRYKTMKGFRVERKAGWDTHGLPVEIQVEKQLGIKQKQEIEKIVPGNPRESIIEFNKKCKESVWEYKDEWEKLTERMAYWVDMNNPYITYENKYIESVWWVVAQIAKLKDKNGSSLVYRGHKVIPYCYRCGTALSSHEVAQGYQTVKDNSIYVKFKLKPNPKKGIDENTFILVWTTTPWTLPGNVALAVGEEIEYCKIIRHPVGAENFPSEFRIKNNEEFYILAKERITDIFKESSEAEITDEFKGKDLIGLEYESLYEITDDKNAYKIIGADFVSDKDGTGIVHIAPAFGEDDAKAGQENNLPTLITVDESGKINVEVPGKGIPVKKKNDKNRYMADDLIIEELKKRGLFFAEEICEHEYPLCWRCDTPLIYYAKPSWFIKMSEIADDLFKNNEQINWVPDYIKYGRFGDWLKNVKDWAISRDRYWGTPIPIWQCECGEIKVVESIKELEDLSGKKLDDLHKPYIDDVKIKCSCGKEMRRTPEVLDVWFDSGSMPLAQFSYPNLADEKTKEKIEQGKYFPADYISEAIDQTRGWFYTLHAIATLLNKAGKIPEGRAYKNVICLAHILDAKGKKMSKSRGNVIDPMETMEKYGADVLRWVLFTINQPGMPKKFDIKAMDDAMSRIFRMILNSYSFFTMYANLDKITNYELRITNYGSWNLLDKWIISELNNLIKDVNEKLENYDIYNAGKNIEKFIDNLSNWYIRRSRRRFWKSEDDADKNGAYQTLYTVLVELAKLMAPFTPFISETIFRNLVIGVDGGNSSEKIVSVHLENYPVADMRLIDEKLNEQMEKTRKIVEMGLAARAKAGVKVRQPLNQLFVVGVDELPEELKELVKDEVNIKKVNLSCHPESPKSGEGSREQSEIIIEENGIKIFLDMNMTEELRVEGMAREIVRLIQEARKKAGFEISDRIDISWSAKDDLIQKAFLDFREYIMRETLAEKMEFSENLENGVELKIDGEEWKLKISKR
ncbi:MAG: isoleucine--tRNA ligase [bacterium]